VEAAFGEPRLVAALLLVTSVILLATRIRRPGAAEVGWGHAWIIGVAQAVAILPGISRSGTTIAVALLLGIARPTAAEFSFLAAIPLILGSVVLSLRELGRSAAGGEAAALGVGFLTSFVVGWVALVWLVRLVRKGQLHWFAIYCAGVALMVFLWPPA
jgi:undecaprenyl-diphosphatase